MLSEMILPLFDAIICRTTCYPVYHRFPGTSFRGNLPIFLLYMHSTSCGMMKLSLRATTLGELACVPCP
jgi:hypothetical protein